MGEWGDAVSDTNNVQHFNSFAALIERAKQERQRLLQQIEKSQRTIDRSREIIARIDEVLAGAERK